MSNVLKTIDLLVKQGQELSESELANQLGTTGNSVRSTISAVRRQGFPIYLNTGSKDTKGRNRVSRYRYGQATREMVASFYAAAA
jgi:transcription initiation factor IIE alpha subunit